LTLLTYSQIKSCMIQIHRLGCNSHHDENFLLDSPAGWDCYILVQVKSRANFWFQGKNGPRTAVNPGTLVIFNKKTPLYYGAAGEEYINDWILFDADDATLQNRSLSFSTALVADTYYPVSEMFLHISNAFFSGKPLSLQICSHLLYALLDMVAELSLKEDPDTLHYPALLELRKQIYHNPLKDWRIPQIAKDLQVSTGYFHSLYKAIFGCTCIHDVINARLETAREMLLSSNLSIKEIAFACSYASQVHFSRQFKSFTGLSPMEYRLKSRLQY